MINLSHLQHCAIALITQIIFGVFTGNWWIGAVAGASFFIGREHTQAEYRWIDKFGFGKRENMPWWGGFDIRVWMKLDAWLDWVLPTVVCAVAAISITTFLR